MIGKRNFLKTVKLTLLLTALFAFISCGNSPDAQGEQSKNQAIAQKQDNQAAQNEAQPMPADQPIVDDSSEKQDSGDSEKDQGNAEPVHLDKSAFLNKVFNYEENPKKWVFEGNRPCIIDFYADWCGPCKKVAPIMKDLAKKYQGKVDVYKIDTDKPKELAQVFGIQSIPSVMFCPEKGKPAMYKGAFPKSKYQKLINKHFEIK